MRLRTMMGMTLAATMLTATTAYAGHWDRGYRYGGHYGSYHHHHHHKGVGVALGVAGAVIGTAILVDALNRPRTTYVVQQAPPPPAQVHYHYAPPQPRYYPDAFYASPNPPSPAERAYQEGYRAGLRDGGDYYGGIPPRPDYYGR